MGRIWTRPRTQTAADLLVPGRKPIGPVKADVSSLQALDCTGYWVALQALSSDTVGSVVLRNLMPQYPDGLLVAELGSGLNVSVQGPYGLAVKHLNDDDRIEIADNALYDVGANGLSVSFWIRFDDATTNRFVLGKAAGGWDAGWGIVTSSGWVRFFHDYWTSEVATFPTVSNNEWHHIVGTTEGATGTIRIYVDGVEGNSGTNTSASSGTGYPLFIGPSGAYDSNLTFDNVFIFQRVLTSRQVISLYRDAFQYLKPANDAPFLFPAAPTASCALTEDITNESDITGGTTEITLELTDDTWDASLGTDHASTDALIAGIDGDVAGGTGWDAKVKAIMDFDDVTRNSDTLCTIVVPQAVDYDISSTETITIIVPAAAVAGASPIATTPATFEIASVEEAVGPPVGSLALMGLGI